MKRIWAAMLAVLLVLGATVTACWLVNVWHESRKQEGKMEALRQRAARPAVTDVGTTFHETGPAVPIQRDESESPQGQELHDLAALQKDNPDCIAWVSVHGTPIDYPVMQSKAEPEFYLKHDFDRRYSEYGLPFLDSRCDLDGSGNLIIYGHHMNDGRMFSALLNYENEDYCAEHPEIVLETGQGADVYRVAAVLRAAGSYAPGEWSVFNCISLDDQTVQEIRNRQLYDTGVGLSPGDKLLILATCEYSQHNGRLAVIAVKE